MSTSQFYSEKFKNSLRSDCIWLYQASKEFLIEITDDAASSPSIDITVAKLDPTDDTVPKSTKEITYRRITEDQFAQYYKENINSFLNKDFRGGEFYVKIGDDGTYYDFYGYTEKPRQYCYITIYANLSRTDLRIGYEKSHHRRREVRRFLKPVPEGVFLQIYRLVIEFCIDRTTLNLNQDTLFQQIKALTGAEEPVEGVVINQDFYYTRAKEAMLKRRNEIEARLVEMDDAPSRRKELRAEMKGIDYCVHILEGYK